MANDDKDNLDTQHYIYVCSQVRYFVERIHASFEFFVKLYSAVLGGTIWLSVQPGITAEKSTKFLVTSNALVIGLTLLSCFKLWDNVRAWRGYRHAQVKLTGLDEHGHPKTPPPKNWPTHFEQIVVTAAMIGAAILYCVFNPLGA
jgi:hypothetical protein